MTAHPLIRRPLLEGWTVSAIAGPVPAGEVYANLPAAVPGLVHLDLLRNGLIDDPFDGDNEAVLSWIGRVDWQYRTEFEWSPEGFTRYDLVAEGLDTVATVQLNGVVVGRSQNQHRAHRFDLRPALVPGLNTLSVTFAAPVEEVERRANEYGTLPHVNHHPYNTLRKTASNFGWDWGIDVATSGIWKWIGLESWSGARVAETNYQTSVVAGVDPAGELRATVRIERDGLSESPVVVRVAMGELAAEATIDKDDAVARVTLRKPSVELWWPRGHGEQPLYPVDQTLLQGGLELSMQQTRVGFRTIELITAPDEIGSPFDLHINGRLIRIRGANWIPDHAFITEVDSDRYGRRIADAVDANMNLLRVWGGGIYESEDFYGACDEQGVLVWQDFLFACAAYAEEDWLSAEVEMEAREQINRLSPHASLVVWNGNNENIWLRLRSGWRPEIAGRTWGNGYYRDLLPSLLRDLDPTRAYSPASPYSFDDYLYPNDPENGTMHIWDVWNEIDYSEYRRYSPRFVSEFGFQGPPAWSTLSGVVHDDPLDPYGAEMLVHQKAIDGNLKLERGMAPHLPEPRDIHDWHWAAQLNQAQAVRFAVEHFRSLSPVNSGSIVWQLNDNWPVISWAAVDFNEHRKPLWYALRASFSPRLATIQPRGDELALVLVNDTGEPWREPVTISRVDFEGNVLESFDARIDAPAFGEQSLLLPARVAVPVDPRRELVTATPATQQDAIAIWNFEEVRNQHLRPDALGARAAGRPDGCVVSVTAREYVRDVFLQVDRVDPRARVDAGMVSLLAGQTAEFTVSGCAGIDPRAFLAPRVLRSANDLLGP
jgi:beta-mannosidase